MQKMVWLKTHLGSIEEAKHIVNQFGWDISVIKQNQHYYVVTGTEEKHVIFSADSREAVDAFLYGMGLAYVGIPTPLFEKLVEDIKDWYDTL